MKNLIIKGARSIRNGMQRILKFCIFWLHDVWSDGQLSKFWFHDIWFDKLWDRQRRKLLFKQSWSYIRFPSIPTEHFPDPCNLKTAEEEQISFSTTFKKKIDFIQTHALVRQGVYLSFRPIGKNLRLLGTSVRENVIRNRKTYILEGGPPTEELMVSQKGYSWNPWLWGRRSDYKEKEDDDRNTTRGWNTYFKQPSTSPIIDDLSVEPKLKKPRLSDGPFNRSYLQRVLEIAAATSYVFSPIDSIIDQASFFRQKLHWPGESEQILGIHIRRGDAASCGTDNGRPPKATRISFPISSYLAAADIICAKYNIHYIYIATESEEEIERAIRLRPQYKILFLEHDRSIFPNLGLSDQFIEHIAFEQPDRIYDIMISAILDLYFLQDCHAFIGTFNSEFSILGWLLIIGNRRHLVPYISLSKPRKQRSLNPLQAMLNVYNNCPLDLYHW